MALALMEVGPRLPHELPKLDEALASILRGVEPEFLWQAQRMPAASRALLLEREEPQSVASSALLEELQLSKDEADLDAQVVRKKGMLTAQACATLRTAVDHERRETADTVDGAADHQLNVSRERLAGMIGEEAVEALWRLPGEVLDEPPTDAQVFIRRYTPDTRPWNPWHLDSAAVTVNVALSDDDACDGGELLALLDAGVTTIPRIEGEATVHSSSLLHAVRRVASGVRYSLVLFFGKAKPKPQPAELEFDDDARADEAETLRELMADEELRHTVGTTLGEDQLDSLHRTFDDLTDADPTPIAIGRVIELVIQSYGAPHLRPTSIRARARDGKIRESSMSLRALMRYIAGELRNEC